MSGQGRRAATSFHPDAAPPKSPRPDWMLDPRRHLPRHPPAKRPPGCTCPICKPEPRPE